MANEVIEVVGLAVKITSAVFLFTQLAGWAVALAGVAILQQNCNAHNSDFNFPAPAFGLGPNAVEELVALAAAGGNPQAVNPATFSGPTSYDCGMQYSWYWWVLALQTVASIGGILVSASVLKSGRLWVLAFFSITTTLWCIFAYSTIWEVTLYQRWGQDNLRNNRWATGYCCGAAGAIIVLVGNFAFLVILGTTDVWGRSIAEIGTKKAAGAAAEQPETTGLGTGGTTAETTAVAV